MCVQKRPVDKVKGSLSCCDYGAMSKQNRLWGGTRRKRDAANGNVTFFAGAICLSKEDRGAGGILQLTDETNTPVDGADAGMPREISRRS